MTDTYTKTILTIIALALMIIAMKLGSPQPAHAMFGGPTIGDLTNAKGDDKRKIMMQIPLVKNM